MRVRALRGFILGPGRQVSNGDIFEIDQRTIQFAGASVTLGWHLPSDYYERLPDPSPAPDPAPADTGEPAARATQPSTTTSPDATNPVPRAPRRRAAAQKERSS